MTDARDAIHDDLLERARAHVRGGVRAVLIQLPTGGGKGTMIVRACGRGRRVLVIVPLIVLADDMVRRLTAAGIRAGIMQAASATDVDAPVQVATIATLGRRRLPDVDLVIVDEARHAASDDLRAILASYSTATLLGFDATPERADGKPLGDIFEVLVHGPQVRDLVACGALVPSEVIVLGAATNALASCPITAYEHHTPGRRAVVFCEDVTAAQRAYETAWTRGHSAALIVSGTSRRRREELLAADPRLIIGVGVMREGWDRPQVDVVILARGFDHVSGWLQCIGRGLRSHQGKSLCTVLDLRGSVHTLGLPDEDYTWSLTSAVVRTRPAPIHRCIECGAVFRESPPCPRCGAASKRVRKKRPVLSAAEKMARIEAAPAEQRDRLRFEALRRQAFMWAPRTRIDAIARTMFRKKYGHDYEATG